MPRKKIAASGGLGALITLLMATLAFKKKELPKLTSASSEGPPNKTQIRDWLRVARQICRSEGVQWIIRTAEAMQLDEDTQEYYLSDPDDETNTVELEATAIDMHDKKSRKPMGLILKLMHQNGAGSAGGCGGGGGIFDFADGEEIRET